MALQVSLWTDFARGFTPRLVAFPFPHRTLQAGFGAARMAALEDEIGDNTLVGGQDDVEIEVDLVSQT